MNNLQNKVIVDEIEYEVDQLSPEAQQQLAIYQQWESDLNQQRLALTKTECAMKFLSGELVAAIRLSKKDTSETVKAAND